MGCLKKKKENKKEMHVNSQVPQVLNLGIFWCNYMDWNYQNRIRLLIIPPCNVIMIYTYD